MGLDGNVCEQPGVGHRDLSCDLGPARPARARRRRRRAAAPLPLAVGALQHVDRRPSGRGIARCESDSVGAATGSPFVPYTLLRLRALQGTEADLARCSRARPSLAAAKGQGVSTSRRWATAVLCNGLGRYEEAAAAAQEAAVGLSDPETRDVGIARARRGGFAQRGPRHGARCARAAHPSDTTVRHRLRTRRRSSLPGIAERRTGGRAPLSRSDRAAEPYPTPPGPCSRPPPLRGVASPRGPAGGRAQPAATSPRHARGNRDGGIRRARPPGADRNRREGAQAQRQPPSSSRRRRSRSPDSLATACRTRRSARSSSSAPAPWNGTCARSSRSSRSALADSSGQRSRRTAWRSSTRRPRPEPALLAAGRCRDPVAPNHQR